MKLLEGRWVVEELVEDEGDDVEADAHVVADPPSMRDIVYHCSRNDGSEHSKGQRAQEDEGDDRPTLLVRDKLSEHDAKGQLAGSANAVASVCNDEHGDILGKSTENAAD